jgi:hypothetical protein
MQVEPLLPVWIIGTIAIALMVVFGWLEWKRNTKLLGLRLSAVVAMMLSVMLYLLQPGIPRTRITNGVVVLTPNYLAAQVDSVRAQHPDFRFLVLPEAASYPNAEKLNSINEVLTYQDQIRVVMGDGLPEWALPKAIKFIMGTKPNGIISLHKPDKIIANRKAILTGVWNGEATSLVLVGPGGTLDSVQVKAGANPFSLSFKPQQTGKFLFALKASATKSEEIPIEVLPIRSLKILMLQAYPSAETRYLKNFLIEQGHGVAMRTQVSKSNYRTEFGNRKSINLNRITADLLNEFDLVILANETVLSKAEQVVLEKSIRSGLGLLWLSTSEEMQKSFFGFEAAPYADDTARVQLEDKEIVLPAVAMQIKSEITPVIANANRTLSGYKVLGAGKLGVHLLQEAYTLLVKGEQDYYGSLWSPVLEALARPVFLTTKIKIKNDFPIYPHEPVEIEIISSQPLPEVMMDSVSLPLREDAVIDNYWTTTFWTTQPGWHAVTSLVDSSTTNFYVSKPKAWQGIRSTNLQTLNNTNQASSVNSMPEQSTVDYADRKVEVKRISPLWFFILFLLSAGFLWLVPKL